MTIVHDDLDLRDPELVHAAKVLSRSLVRFHPSFRFEERLAARLRGEARSRLVADDSHAPGAALAPLAEVAVLPMPVALELATPAPLGRAVGRVPRPVLVGGAIASGMSIAGAAVVAWRRLRRDA
ncbi:MAG TPA: hypothetical protein VN800_05785 [Candidatus Acidoferrales bacterium]|nr:hypothetical protein [Candidatus Acidoferrales bacterium]